ncbi:MAG: rod shape-determining protein MreC [Bacilli bacterium]|nr:rod shape-determining protein MreC [Bacilli bacterium]
MKNNYLLYIVLLIAIIFQENILYLTTNVTKQLFQKNENIELKLLQSENNYLSQEYNKLLDFKNNINMNKDYTVTNIIKTSYGFNSLLISGKNYNIGDEVVNEEGLIGVISKIGKKSSELEYIFNTNLIVRIGTETGKIINSDQDKNLIISEISNYNNIKINDLVYSLYGTYIGKIIKIKYDILDNYLTVKTVALNDLNYVAVINRQI